MSRRSKTSNSTTGHNPTKANKVADSMRIAMKGIQRNAKNKRMTRKSIENVMLMYGKPSTQKAKYRNAA